MAAARLLCPHGLYGPMMAILRQELDSMVKMIFLVTQSQSKRQHYINQALSNEKWTLPGTKTQITDRQMVDFANTINGWERSAYKLGCAFIHLSAMSDYNHTNPFLQLPLDEQRDIKQHLNNYHGFPLTYNLSVETVGPYLLKVLEKISSNLEYEIQKLQRGFSLPSRLLTSRFPIPTDPARTTDFTSSTISS
jgi:hypothetical protein